MELGSDPTEAEVAAWLAQLPPDEAWQWRASPVLMPVPTAEVSPLRGERVVVFDANLGVWVYDQFTVTEPHQRDGVGGFSPGGRG